MNAEHKPSDILEVLSDPRVVRAVERALRDQIICRRFQVLRAHATVEEATRILARDFSLSHEHIRTIVYRKQAT